MELTAEIVAMYMGQKCRTPDGIGVLCGISQDGIVKVEFGAFGPDFEVSHTLPFVKPILRRLESLTEMEAVELFEAAHGTFDEGDENERQYALEFFNSQANFWIYRKERLWGYPVGWLKLLLMGFDLFGLIESGVAVDAATLEKTDEI